MLKQAGQISGGANKNLSSSKTTTTTTTGGGSGGGAAGANTNSGGGGGGPGGETSFVQAVLKLKNGGGGGGGAAGGNKMGTTGSSTLAGTVSAALAQQQQQSQQQPSANSAQHPLPDINVINVPEYPERISRRTGGPGAGGPLKAGEVASSSRGGGGGAGGLQQPPQQNKGLSAPLADISSSGPNGKISHFQFTCHTFPRVRLFMHISLCVVVFVLPKALPRTVLLSHEHIHKESAGTTLSTSITITFQASSQKEHAPKSTHRTH